MKRTYVVILSVLGLFITVTGIAFAFFYATNNDSDVGVSGAAKEINTVEYIPGTSLQIPSSGIYPGWIGVQDFQIAVPNGITSGSGTYEIVLETNIHEDYSDWITYELYKTTDMGNTITRVEGTLSDDVYNLYVDDSLTPNGFTIPDDSIASGVANSTSGDISVDKVSYDLSTFEDTKYYLVIRFLNEDINQNAAINKYFEITIKMKQVVNEGIADESGANPPVLDSTMIPVLIEEGTGSITIADTTKEWYNYTNSEWANAVIVNETFTQRNPGTEIPIDEIMQMYVWIPRFEYTKSSITDPSDAIEIRFVGTDITSTTNQVNNDDTIVHPAFCWGNTCQTVRSDVENKEIPGFWIGKFENTSYNPNIIIKPNTIISLSDSELIPLLREDNSISGSYSITTYNSWTDVTLNITADEHAMKSLDWGAVAYLAQSQYGICNTDGTCTNSTDGTDKEIQANTHYFEWNGYNTVSGCIGDGTIIKVDEADVFNPYSINAGVSDKDVGICPESNRWQTSNGVMGSTTHNVTGVYDMAGGADEYVSTHFDDQYGTYPAPTSIENKYYDQYLILPSGSEGMTSFDNTYALIGDAFKELVPLTAWNSGSYYMSMDSHILRGGSINGSEYSYPYSTNDLNIWYSTTNNYYYHNGTSYVGSPHYTTRQVIVHE